MAQEYSAAVAQLLTEVQQGMSVPVTVTIEGQASGLLVHEQSKQVRHKDGSIEVQVSDRTNVDYTLSHELLHMLMNIHGFSQLSFPLTSGKPQLDEQMGATATALYNSVKHVYILAQQETLGLINETVRQDYLDGIYASVPEEDPNKQDDNLIIFRVLSLLDVLVFFKGGDDKLKNEWLLKYPEAYPLAMELYHTLMAKSVDTPFAFRRGVIALFRKFETQIDTLGYVSLNHQHFAALSPIYSSRQLRLSLRQVVNILHSDYTDLVTKEKAYLAMGKNDEQAAFVFHDLKASQPPEDFQKLYNEPLQSVLAQEKIHYGIR